MAIKRYKWQLSRVGKDIVRLQSLKETHMADPFEFLRQLKAKEFRYPEGQKTLPAPSIEWTKYQFPPANPVVPTRPQNSAFLSSVSLPTHHDRGNSNIVSLTTSSSHRPGVDSPSNERMRIVKETAKSLGINPVHFHRPTYPHHHIQDAGAQMARIDVNGAEDRNFRSMAGSSRRMSHDLAPAGSSQNPPLAMGSHSHDMEGVIFSSQGGMQDTGYRLDNFANSTQTTLPPPTSLERPSLDTSNSIRPPHAATMDHGLVYNPIQSNNLGNHSNITYNHMSGSIDIQPSMSAKAKGASREGSGVREDPKPPLYNIPWSDEEQQLLEKLLEVYPDEPVAAQRFQKISAAMGTRTPKQVASRVQKYFIKLVKAGLEAPGRMNYSLEPSKPKNKGTSATAKGKKRKDGPGGGGGDENAAPKSKARPRKKEASMEAGPSVEGGSAGSGSGTKKKQKAKSLLGSGFGRTSGTQYLHYTSAPTVYMSEEDDEEGVQDMLAVSHVGGSSTMNSNHPSQSSATRRGSTDGVIAHLGYSCSLCGVEPILGTRFSCIDCEVLGSTELCGPCYNAGTYQSGIHLVSHRFQSIETAEMPAYSYDYQSMAAGPSGTSSHDQ
ncbi:ZZ-type zinc finger-containing protein 3 [Mortierella sp. NVP85]|nr:ZZ-type zinc finger-containing protein 3 [Mortierella sp. NVP85]